MGAIVRIRYHREIPCHVNASDEDRFDVIAMLRTASERYPGIVVALRVFFKCEFKFDVFPISAVLCDKCRSLFLGEFEREAGTRFQESRVAMRNVGEVVFDEPYGAVATEAPAPAPDSLTVLVQR